MAGRTLIANAKETLTPQEAGDLALQRDQAVLAWEEALAATALHYINDTLQAMATFGSAEYDFVTHAKVWSEMKGFALGLQFNPRSKVSQADFVTLHELMRSAPVLPTAQPAEVAAYKADLIKARGILASSYTFDPKNVGDEEGNNGW